MKFITVILGFQYVAGVLSAGRYLIDRTSCTGDMYDTMKSYMDSAQKWAEEICDILEPYIQDPNQRPNDRFMNLAWRLFGANDIATMDGIYNRFNSMRRYVYVNTDNRNPWWKDQERDPGDLEIFCNADHIVPQDHPVDDDVAWWDVTRDCPIANDDLILQHKVAKTNLLATAHVAVPDGNQQSFPSHWSEYIVYHPNKLRKAIDKQIIFNDKRVQKASSLSLLSRIRRAYDWHYRNVTPADMLKSLDIQMIHELSHLVACGDSIEVRGDRSYGWDNAFSIRSQENADNLAFFVMVDQLNRHYNLDVNDDGKIVKIT